MDIYYNDQVNEVSLIFKGFVVGDFSDDGCLKANYSLGELFINYIELDHEKIIKMIEDDFNLIEKDYNKFELNINNFFNKLTKIHPYFFDFVQTFISIIDICQDELQLKNETKQLKKELIRYVEVGKKYKEAVEICLDYENPSEYSNLSTLERYFLYEQTENNPRALIFPSYRIGTKENLDKRNEDISVSDTSNYIELKKLLPKEPLVIFEMYQTNIEGVCYFEFIKLVTKGIFVRKCKNCNKYFINTGRADTLYCDRLIDGEEKTCKDVGAMNIYREKTKNDPIMDEYNKIYKRNNARVRYKKMSKNDFYIWSEKARKIRDKARSGEITLEEFKEWLAKK